MSAIPGSPAEVKATPTDSMLFTDTTGAPITGLDAGQGDIHQTAKNFPDMPQVSDRHISLNSEAVVRLQITVCS